MRKFKLKESYFTEFPNEIGGKGVIFSEDTTGAFRGRNIDKRYAMTYTKKAVEWLDKNQHIEYLEDVSKQG